MTILFITFLFFIGWIVLGWLGTFIVNRASTYRQDPRHYNYQNFLEDGSEIAWGVALGPLCFIYGLGWWVGLIFSRISGQTDRWKRWFGVRPPISRDY